MTTKEFADRINGSPYEAELTRGEEELAKENGLVVVFGASDDLMELRGAIQAELSCYEGGTVYVNRKGLTDPIPYCNNTDCPHYRRERDTARKNAATITVVWHERGNPFWTYKTDIPHEKFSILGDPCDEASDRVNCIGIVFKLEDLPEESDIANEQGWILVEKKLPGPFESVLINIKTRNGYDEPVSIVEIGSYNHDTETWEPYLTPDKKLIEGEVVTAWMPLPEPLAPV